MVRIEVKKEKRVEFIEGVFKEEDLKGYQVYICCDELTAWILSVKKLKELDTIFCYKNPLDNILIESLSETEYNILWRELNFHGGYYNHKKELIRF